MLKFILAKIQKHSASTQIARYRRAGFCCEDFNLAIGSICNFQIFDHFIRDILQLTW